MEYVERMKIFERRHDVYHVEEYWREWNLECATWCDPLVIGDVEGFFAAALVRRHVVGARVVAFDVADTIHLHPKMLERETSLHELADWVSGEGHTARWAEVYVELVRGEFGDEAADVLIEGLRVATAPSLGMFYLAKARGDLGVSRQPLYAVRGGSGKYTGP